MHEYLIQYTSNLFVHQNHTLAQSKYLLKTGICPNLALLGNIGSPHSQKTKDFIHWCSKNWNNVYYVPGPTEYIDSEKPDIVFSHENVHILDQSEKLIHPKLALVGSPLWTGWSDTIAKIPSWNEEERYFMAHRTPKQLQSWHTEDVGFIAQKLHTNDAQNRNVILLTHTVYDLTMLRSGNQSYRNIYLHDGRIRDLRTLQLIGVLSGAGGGSYNGTYGGHMSAAVNCAFQGPNMVPNSQYKRDAIARFRLDDHWYGSGKKVEYVRTMSLVNLSKYLPQTDIGALTCHANTVLQ